MKKLGFIVIGTVLAPVFSTPALGITLGPLDGASSFSNDGGTAGPGNINNSTLNSNGSTTPGGNNTGFESFFTSNFGRVGGVGSTQNGTENGISRRISNSFTFSNTDLASTSQSVTFDYAFDGTSGTSDTFSGYFAASGLTSTPLGPVFSTNQLISPGGISNANFSVASSTFTPGTPYVLAFQLNEATGNGNSAAGFDNVTLTSTATPVPFDFSPGLGILALGIWGAIAQLKSKVKNKKSLEVSSLTSNEGQAESV